MFLSKKVLVLFVFCFFLSILTGCLGPSPEEKIYTTLEEVVALENSFKEQQQPLLDLEKKEAELYNKIISLGKKEFNEAVLLSKEAAKIVEERESKIEIEHESIQSSKEEFSKLEKEIKNIEEQQLKKKAESLSEKMEQRYLAYEKLYKAYNASLSLDKELYNMLQDKSLTLEQLDAHIKKINDSYQVVMEYNEDFNNLTDQYNKLKMEFYEAAELNIKKS